MKISGIYAIICLSNNKKYVGSSANIERRWGEHRAKLRYNNHGNPHLQNAWNLYGENQFNFQIIELVEPEMLLDIEQKYLNDLQENKSDYYNINPNSAARLGAKHTDATRKKMSLAKSGKNNPSFGRKHTLERNKKISESHKKQTIYSFINDITNEEFTGIISDFIKKFNVTNCGVSQLIHLKQKYHYGWKLKNNLDNQTTL